MNQRSSGEPAEPPEVGTGVVKWFDARRGYGFIRREAGAADLFVHGSEVAGDEPLRPGEAVRFEVVEGRRGLQARAVRRTTEG